MLLAKVYCYVAQFEYKIYFTCNVNKQPEFQGISLKSELYYQAVYLLVKN